MRSIAGKLQVYIKINKRVKLYLLKIDINKSFILLNISFVTLIDITEVHINVKIL